MDRLTAWQRRPAKSLYNGYKFEWEWFRHNKKCQTLWVGGNVSLIPFKGYVRGIDYRWYTGDPPIENPDFSAFFASYVD